MCVGQRVISDHTPMTTAVILFLFTDDSLSDQRRAISVHLDKVAPFAPAKAKVEIEPGS